MASIKQVLQGKGHDVWSIGPEASVLDALTMMAEKEVGALAVTDADKLVGVVTERDYARKVVLQGRSSESTKIKEIMTSRVAYTRPEQSVEECMAVMTDKRIRHLPVMDGERLLGMISIGDLVKSIIEEQQQVIEQLEQYISR
jgi:CBS domain-containing protein